MTSQSPLAEALTLDYEDGWAAVNRLIRTGLSWSGLEFDSAFWNAGDGTFIDVSHTFGLGMDFDGRSYARVDWDGDGDLDIWLRNRTAPQVQFLRNDGSGGNFLRLQLEGAGTNSEAIGARVEVKVAGQTLVQERRLGSGYLGQSSSWLHFGLGAATTVESLRVRWPNGEWSDYDVAANSRYRLAQEETNAVLIAPSKREVTLEPAALEKGKKAGNARIALTQRLVLPQLTATTFDGQTLATPSAAQPSPALVNFWSSTCQNCLAELKQWSGAHADLEAAGLNVIALAVDEDPRAAQDRWSALALPWSAGMAPERWIALFDLLQQIVVDRQRDMVVPTSFLLDSSGKLAVIYRGPVEADQLLADVRALEDETPAFAGAPFPGRHFGAATPVSLEEIAHRFLDQERAEEALFYIDASSDSSNAVTVADSLMRTAMLFLDRGNLVKAESSLARAQKLASDDAYIWMASARLKIAQRDLKGASSALQKSLELDPDLAQAWDLLASVSLVERDLDGAIESSKKATALDSSLVSAWSTQGIALLTRGNFEDATPAFERVVELAPMDSDGWTGLGVCRLKTGQVEEGVRHLEHALELDPKNTRALGVLQQLGRR